MYILVASYLLLSELTKLCHTLFGLLPVRRRLCC